MALTLDELERQAIALAAADRARLAERLLDSLAGATADVAGIRHARDVEIASRIDAHDRGALPSVDAAEVFDEARRLAR